MAAGTTHKEASDHKTSHPIAGNKLSASPIIQRQHSAQRVGPCLLAAIIRLGSTESCDELYCTEMYGAYGTGQSKAAIPSQQ